MNYYFTTLGLGGMLLSKSVGVFILSNAGRLLDSSLSLT